MTGTGVLDMDMTTLARQLRGGWDWWLEELGALLPAGTRERFTPKPGVVATFDGTGFTLTQRGQPVAPPRGGRDLAVAVALPAAMALTREVWLPLLGPGDLRRLVTLDLDRLMPFPVAAAVVDHRVLLRDPGNQRQLVAIAALPRDRAEAVLAAAADAGLAPVALGLVQPDGPPRFDFLPGLAADGIGAAGARARRFWWGVVAAAIVLNLVVLVARDVQATRSLEALVEEHGETARLARTLRSRVVGEETRRQALIARRAATDPLALLADVTRLLPDSAWVQRLAWNGRQLRLGGFVIGTGDVVAELKRAPRFAAARPTASEIAPRSRGGQPFDVTVDVPVPR